jgi:hypothetical protein
VPTARADEQHRSPGVGRIVAAGFGIVEGDLSADRVDQVRLSFDQIVPARRRRIFEIGHIDIGPAIEGVDHHLAVGRPGDLDAAVLEVAQDRRDPPVVFADRFGRGQEIGLPPGIEAPLDCGPLIEQSEALGAEFAFEAGNKGDRLCG